MLLRTWKVQTLLFTVVEKTFLWWKNVLTVERTLETLPKS